VMAALSRRGDTERGTTRHASRNMGKRRLPYDCIIIFLPLLVRLLRSIYVFL
jgi:hypothetical protein